MRDGIRQFAANLALLPVAIRVHLVHASLFSFSHSGEGWLSPRSCRVPGRGRSHVGRTVNLFRLAASQRQVRRLGLTCGISQIRILETVPDSGLGHLEFDGV